MFSDFDKFGITALDHTFFLEWQKNSKCILGMAFSYILRLFFIHEKTFYCQKCWKMTFRKLTFFPLKRSYILGVKNIEFYDDLENVIYYSDFKGQKFCYVPFFRFLVLIFIFGAFLLLDEVMYLYSTL